MDRSRGVCRPVRVSPRRAGPLVVGLTAVALAGGACGGHSTNGVSVAMPEAAAERVTPRLTPAPRRTPDPNDVCRGRVPCSIEARHDAGLSAAGNAMTVVELSLGMLLDDRKSEKEPGLRNCERREVWLLHAGSGAPVARKLLAMCNNGYGASGVGTDEIIVEPNTLHHVRDGGSAWRWSTTRTARLDPPAVVRERHSGSWTMSMNHDSSTDFDFETFQGFATREWPACDADGNFPGEGEPEIEPLTWQPIVAMALPPAFVSAPIHEGAAIDLAACATRSGPQEPGRGASYALVMDEETGTLLAQIQDDTFGRGDRLRIWATAPDAPHLPEGDGLFCWKPRRIAALEIDVDGNIVAGTKTYPGVTVEVGRGSDATRRLFRVRLGNLPRLITVGYLDVDPKRPVARIATSDVEAAKGERIHLGNVFRVSPRRAECVVDGTRLVPRAVVPHDVDAPLIDDL